MKTLTTYAFCILVLLSCQPSAFSQQHLDIAFEGPWLFYEEPAFVLDNAGHTSPALVAIAPDVLHHFPATFSTGDGFPFDTGVYCVGFGGACSLDNIPALRPGDYPPAGLVPVKKPAHWDWRTLTSAYVLILPMPNSHSADGQYSMTFHATFPTAGTPSPVTSQGAYALGLHLHYPNGPSIVSLLECPAVPTAATCTSPQGISLNNSGTLRITIKSDEIPGAADPCDYHSRRAYHKMIHLLDDSLSANSQNAFVNVPSYDSCARCDPQQDLIPSDCSGMGMMSLAGYASLEADVPGQLTDLVGFLEKLDFRKDQVDLGKLEALATALAGKSPALSQLRVLKNTLEDSTNALNVLLETMIAAHKTESSPRRQDLTMALQKEATLDRAIDFRMYTGTSGKDCRAAEMLIK